MIDKEVFICVQHCAVFTYNWISDGGVAMVGKIWFQVLLPGLITVSTFNRTTHVTYTHRAIYIVLLLGYDAYSAYICTYLDKKCCEEHIFNYFILSLIIRTIHWNYSLNCSTLHSRVHFQSEHTLLAALFIIRLVSQAGNF